MGPILPLGFDGFNKRADALPIPGGLQMKCCRLLLRSRLLLFSVALCFATMVIATAPAPVAGAEPPATVDAVRQVLDSQVAAWNKGDLEGFMAGYWHSPELSFFSGKDKRQGWQETMDRYRQRYQAEGREMGKLTFSDIQIEPLSPDTAWVRGRWKLVMSKESPGGLFTLVFRKLPEGWRIVHDHTSG